MRPFLLLAPLLLFLAPVSGCASGDNHWVEIKGQRIRVEIADNHEERARGLMFRDRLAPGTGMLFLFDSQQPQAFWMKNTRIPLDILYFDRDKRLVSARRGTPPCSMGDRCPPYPSSAPAQYVLELNAGEADQFGLASGDQLSFGPGIPEQGSP